MDGNRFTAIQESIETFLITCVYIHIYVFVDVLHAAHSLQPLPNVTLVPG